MTQYRNSVDNKPKNIEKLIGIISDTHGLLRSEAVEALRGAELILHAGDVGSAEVLETLKAIAPVVAVRGNNDKVGWAEELPHWEVVEVGVVYIYMIHDVKEIDLSPDVTNFDGCGFGKYCDILFRLSLLVPLKPSYSLLVRGSN